MSELCVQCGTGESVAVGACVDCEAIANHEISVEGDLMITERIKNLNYELEELSFALEDYGYIANEEAEQLIAAKNKLTELVYASVFRINLQAAIEEYHNGQFQEASDYEAVMITEDDLIDVPVTDVGDDDDDDVPF